MNVKKFQGKTEEEAIASAKQEFGEDAVIMFSKEVKPKGLFSVFKSPFYEVTAAMKEKESGMAPVRSAHNPKALHDSINLAADEKIDLPRAEAGNGVIPQAPAKPVIPRGQERKGKSGQEESGFEERLDKLSDRLEEKLGTISNEEEPKAPSSEELNFVRILYSTLIRNEVNEKYVNQILDEVEKFIRPGNSVDIILSNI